MGSSLQARGQGKWSLTPGRLSLHSTLVPWLRDRFGVPGRVSPALTSCPPHLPGRCPHGAGPVCQAHRLSHQAGEPGSSLPSSPSEPGHPLPSPSSPPSQSLFEISWVTLHSPSTSTDTLSSLEKDFSPSLPLIVQFLSGWGGSGDGSRRAEGKDLLGDSATPSPQTFPFATTVSSLGQTFLLVFYWS